MKFDFLLGIRHVQAVHKVSNYQVTLVADVNRLRAEKQVGDPDFSQFG
jgi:hypothetical protein